MENHPWNKSFDKLIKFNTKIFFDFWFGYDHRGIYNYFVCWLPLKVYIL